MTDLDRNKFKYNVKRYGGSVPATLVRVSKTGVVRYAGVVADDKLAQPQEFCPHNHVFPDTAMTCARRMRTKRSKING